MPTDTADGPITERMTVRCPPHTSAAFAPAPHESVPTIPGFDLVELIGHGGCGRVYRAWQHTLARFVAIKVIDGEDDDPLAGRRFAAEAVAVAGLRHPHIVTAHDFGSAGGRLYLVMELLDGMDLGKRIRADGPLDERSAWQVIRQAATGLAHAAEHGVIHRDVKPANLFVTVPPAGERGGQLVKVTDFGLAISTHSGSDRLTGDGNALGTPSYMAPEQWRGGALDHRADIYALGATAYHALVGRPPFDGTTVWRVLEQKIAHTLPPLPRSLLHSAELIRDMMHPDPAKRVQTYPELLDLIDRLPVLSGKAPSAPRRWHRWRVAAGVATVLLVGSVVLTLSLHPRQQASGATARYVSDGAQEALFDGQSLNQWGAAGNWAVGPDEEGTAVLTGTGTIRRRFADLPDYRLTFGVDLFEASAAEVQFALPASSDAGRRMALRLTREGWAELGTRDGDRGEFRPCGNRVAFPSANWLKGRRPYLEARVERAGGWWSVWFHGTSVGRVADDGSSKRPELRIWASDGQARIDTVVFERLHPEE
jgi:serine/threonine protein kinase